MTILSSKTVLRQKPIFPGLFLVVFLVAFCCSPIESACASDLYILSLINTTFPDPDVAVILDSQYGSPVTGWALSLCHEQENCDLNEVYFGDALLTLPDPPFFHETTFFTGGFNAACVLGGFSNVFLYPAPALHLYDVDYDWSPTGNGFTTIEFCDSGPPFPGNPPVFVSEGVQYNPITFDTFLFNGFIDPALIYEVPRTVTSYNASTGAGSFTVTPPIYPALLPSFAITGFSMAIAHDETLLNIDSVIPIDIIADLNGGSGPDQFLVELLPDGWTVDAVFGPTGTETISFLDPIFGLEASYSTQPGAIALGSCVGSWLRFDSSLGVPNEVDFDIGFPFGAMTFDDIVILVPVTNPMRRGDCNDDTTVNLADAIFSLGVLFAGLGPAPCVDACDHNDDGGFNVADAVYLLTYLFGDGPAPPEPGIECGEDPTADSLACSTNSCP